MPRPRPRPSIPPYTHRPPCRSCAQGGVSLIIKRFCALPSCSAHDGKQHSAWCSAESCGLAGRPHTKLFSGCTAAEHAQKPLWRAGSDANNPASGSSFPAAEELMGSITLPEEHEGKVLRELSLSVRAAPAEQPSVRERSHALCASRPAAQVCESQYSFTGHWIAECMRVTVDISLRDRLAIMVDSSSSTGHATRGRRNQKTQKPTTCKANIGHKHDVGALISTNHGHSIPIHAWSANLTQP